MKLRTFILTAMFIIFFGWLFASFTISMAEWIETQSARRHSLIVQPLNDSLGSRWGLSQEVSNFIASQPQIAYDTTINTYIPEDYQNRYLR